jgi:hypothetical protein
MAKAFFEYSNFLEISFQRALPTVPTKNRGNAMIMWRTVTDIIFLFLLSDLHIFWSLAINSYYWATITSNLVTRDLTDIYRQKIDWVIDDPVLVLQVSMLFWFLEG